MQRGPKAARPRLTYSIFRSDCHLPAMDSADRRLRPVQETASLCSLEFLGRRESPRALRRTQGGDPALWPEAVDPRRAEPGRLSPAYSATRDGEPDRRVDLWGVRHVYRAARAKDSISMRSCESCLGFCLETWKVQWRERSRFAPAPTPRRAEPSRLGPAPRPSDARTTLDPVPDRPPSESHAGPQHRRDLDRQAALAVPEPSSWS